MEPILHFCRYALTALCVAATLTGQSKFSQPKLTVLHTFRVTGVPTAISEFSLGEFLGIFEAAPAGIFSITSGGKYNTLYIYPSSPASIGAIGLTPALNGQTYGSAANSGTVTTFSELFSVAAGGKITMYPFNPATQGGLSFPPMQSPDGSLYAVFGIVGNPFTFTFDRLGYNGRATVLYTFTAAQGSPVFTTYAPSDGNFYGLTLTNNTATAGIFRLTPAGSLSWLVPSFPTGTFGVQYQTALMQASDGNFYGTLPQGGSANAGSIYRVTPSGQMQTVYEFSQLDLGIPETLLEGSDGMLYGTARGLYIGYQGYSSIFRLNPSSGQFTTIYNFKNSANGECECKVVQGTDGKLYGVALAGGIYGLGTVFVLDAGLPKPKPHVALFKPPSGAAGQQVLLWGSNLLGTTSVSFHGTPAPSFKIASTQGVWVNVPSGATTGPITVTTPNGTFTTKQSFRVE